jgi:hypothetical protein
MDSNDFAIATHTYFRPINLATERSDFLSNQKKYPEFKYPKIYSEDVVVERLSKLKKNEFEHDSLSCVLSSIRLQANDNELERFRRINERLFSEPNAEYAKNAVFRLLRLSDDKHKELKDEIKKIVNIDNYAEKEIGPSIEIFEKYRDYFNRYRKNPKSHGLDVASAICHELAVSGLDEKGWTLKIIKKHCSAKTVHKTKQIIIGDGYMPRKMLASERIAVHEVYGHAMRGPQKSIAESEGFALVLEQLLGKKFRFRRSYRYLAASLGWGCFGERMDFLQVFEVIWRLMVVSSGYNEESAKQFAFDECQRVFRGGRSDLPGAVYLKDICYFAANINCWAVLSKKDIDYEEFVDFIEGRKTILS